MRLDPPQELTRTSKGLFSSSNRKVARERLGELNGKTAEDLAAFVAGETAAVVNDRLMDGEDPLDADQLPGRLLPLAAGLAGSRPAGPAAGHL